MRIYRSIVFKVFFIVTIGILASAYTLVGSGSYLERHTADRITKALPPPPADDSDEHRAELDLVFAAQKSASAQLLQRVQSEYILTPADFQNVIDVNFDQEHYPTTFAFLEKVMEEADVFLGKQKRRFKRLRPFARDSRINGLDIRNRDQLSYPSGHSFRGTLYGLILARLFSEKAAVIIQRSQEIGWNRVVAGMHHPSDVNAGRFLANEIYEEMLETPSFRGDLEKARNEVMRLKDISLID